MFFIGIILYSLSFAHAADVTVLTIDEGTKSADASSKIKPVVVNEKLYMNFLNNSLKKVLKSREFKRRSDEFRLNHLVIGMAADKRVGFWGWNFSSSAAVEYHLKVLNDE